MYGIYARKQWFVVAASILVALNVVFIFHAVIPHQHPHDLLPLGPFGMIHGGLAEKFVLLVLPALIVFLVRADMILLSARDRGTLRIGGQGLEVFERDFVSSLFSRGIVHLNQR